jgi:hypothetical protein
MEWTLRPEGSSPPVVFPTLKLNMDFRKNKCFLLCWKPLCTKIIWHQRDQIFRLSWRCKRGDAAACSNKNAHTTNMWHDSNFCLGNSAPCKSHHWIDRTEVYTWKHFNTLFSYLFSNVRTYLYQKR